MNLNIDKYFRTFKESKFILFYTLAEKLFFFFLFLIIARNYSTEYYGQIIALFTLANLIILFFDFGLPILIQRELSISRNNASKLLSLVLFVSLLSSVLYFAIVFFISGLFYPEIPGNLKIIILLLVYTYSLLSIFHRIFFALSEYKIQFKLVFYIRTVIILLFVLFVVFVDVSLYIGLIILLLGNIVHIFFILFILNKRSINFHFQYLKIENISNLFKLSVPIGFAVIFNYMYDKIDLLMMSKMLDFNQVAFYNVGYGIYKASALAFTFFLISGFTKVSYLSRRTSAIKLFFKKYTLLLLMVSIFISVLFFFAAEFIVNTLYSMKYSNSVIVLKILSAAIIGMALNNLTGIVLNGLGLYKHNMLITIIAVLINIVLNIILIRYYGVIGACIVTIITEYLIFCGGYFVLRKYLKKHL